MTATEQTVVDWNGEGPPPIWDTDHLKARIARLQPEKQANLAEAWASHGLGQLPPLLDAEGYRQAERLVNLHEEGATTVFADAWERLDAVATQIQGLPEHIRQPCAEALGVYAGISDPRAVTLTSVGRLLEAERVVSEAVTYAAAQLDVPSVDDLPPADEHAEQVASNDWPGPKATDKVVRAWVEAGADETAQLNRAARAYAHEQERSGGPRKRLSAFLVERLGPEGLAKVTAALEAAAPPPLDLSSSGVPLTPESGAAGPGQHGPELSDGAASADVEAEPAAPAPSGEVRLPPPPDNTVSDLYRQLSHIFAELAEVTA